MSTPYKVSCISTVTSAKIQELEDVVADGIILETRARFFMRADGRRVEVPTENMVFIFSKERQEVMNANKPS